MYKHIW